MYVLASRPVPKSILGDELLIDSVNQDDPLVIAARAINWERLERNFSKFFSEDSGRPSIPLRRMIGLLYLKFIHKMSDDQVLHHWSANIMFQAFTGEDFFKNEYPCDRSTLSYFRRRVGEEGTQMMFNESVYMFGKEALESTVIIDSTVQEKYSAFPTDTKLALDVIKQCHKIAGWFNITFKKPFEKKASDLRRDSGFAKGKNSREKKMMILKELRSIALILLPELMNKMPAEHLNDIDVLNLFEIYNRSVTQQKKDKNKIYSIFEPQNKCIIKGKQNVYAEFGSKVSVVVGALKGVILSIQSLDGNPFDGHTIDSALSNLKSCFDYLPVNVLLDKGYIGANSQYPVSFIIPEKGDSNLPKAERKTKLKWVKRRGFIEQKISHLKNDFRLGTNFLRGVIGDKINPLLAAAASNIIKFSNMCIDKINSITKRKVVRKKPVKKTINGVAFYQPKLELFKSMLFRY
jgi:IS5 family transposase